MSNSNFGPAQLVFKQSGSGVTGVFGSPIPGGSVPYEGTVRGSVAGAVFTGTLTLTMGSWGYEKLEFPISLTLNPNRFMFDGLGGKNRDGIELRWSGYRDPATLTTPAAPAPRELGWELPDRFGLLDDRGMIRYSKAKADQRSWPVIFTVPGCDQTKLGTLAWQVDGKTATGSKAMTGRKCTVSVDVGTLGRHEVTAKLPDNGQEYKASVVARDYLIVGLGDSVASGEGNPDVRKQAGGPLWQDPRCDRSAESFEAKAALAVEQSSRRTSVSFVHLACSGAAIGKGVSGPYWGISPGDADLPLASQTGKLRSLTAGREIDALLISIGANDLGFGDVLAFCVTWEFCQNRKIEGGKTLRQVIKERLAGLPALYDTMAARLSPLVAANRVYINLYPDELRDADGAYCDDVIRYGKGLRAIRADETKWMVEDFLTPLNATIQAAAGRHGWNVIAGAPELFRQHGYCAGSKAWVVTYEQSFATQGDANGTMHPNGAGHDVMGRLAATLLLRDLAARG
jgi:hypothetical protein